ncbi:hypothetical protein MUK42_33526 [Musa troglodytarum]|uniref:Uncharacterized protein n=1 Tax=Musa troglodytarum TaxID=320322 RepID=A0A9E7F7V3_9LILI|nr:hypothetical protein MUK42_33526 [Musa troglodytarum]
MGLKRHLMSGLKDHFIWNLHNEYLCSHDLCTLPHSKVCNMCGSYESFFGEIAFCHNLSGGICWQEHGCGQSSPNMQVQLGLYRQTIFLLYGARSLLSDCHPSYRLLHLVPEVFQILSGQLRLTALQAVRMHSVLLKDSRSSGLLLWHRPTMVLALYLKAPLRGSR